MNEYDYRDVLRKASELVAEEGRWIQGYWFSTENRSLDRREAMALDKEGVMIKVCALGAVTLAGERLGVSEGVLRGARRRLSSFLTKMGKTKTGVADWNDTQPSSALEVAEALREAADYDPRSKQ